MFVCSDNPYSSQSWLVSWFFKVRKSESMCLCHSNCHEKKLKKHNAYLSMQLTDIIMSINAYIINWPTFHATFTKVTAFSASNFTPMDINVTWRETDILESTGLDFLEAKLNVRFKSVSPGMCRLPTKKIARISHNGRRIVYSPIDCGICWFCPAVRQSL